MAENIQRTNTGTMVEDDDASAGGSNRHDNKQDQGDKKDQKEDHKKPADPRTKWRNIILGVIAGVVVITLAVAWFLYSSTYESTDDAQVDGHLNAIASRVSGTVTAVYAENNQPVKAGQLLVELDARDLQAQEEQARAQYQQALAKLATDNPNVPITQTSNRGTVETDTASVTNAEAAVASARQDYESDLAKLRQAQATNVKNQKDLDRYRQLLEKREIAATDYDQYVANAGSQQASVDASAAAAESARKTIDQRIAQLTQQQSKLREDSTNAPRQVAVKQATLLADRANVASAKAQLDAAELNVSYCKIYAPVNGIATLRSAELGGRVNAAQQVMVVVQTDNVWGTANFKETQLKKMRVGQKVTIKVDSLGESFTGHVEYMPAATGDRNSLFPPENATGNYVKVVQRLPVRILFDKGQRDLEKLRPGMSIEPKVSLD
jgi:membrane fusion protein (multidrug efflux system)